MPMIVKWQCYTDDALYIDPANQEGLQGKDAIRKYFVKSAHIDHDTYLTGRLETEPDTIKSFRIMWEKRPQKAFTERGQDSYVFVGRHSRGFILTVYPTKLVDASYGADAYHT